MGLKLRSSYLTIPVRNFNDALRWYGDHFGFEVVQKDPNYIELQNDAGIKILFQQNEHHLTSQFVYPDGAAQSSYGFMVDDAQFAYRYCIDHGIRVGELFDYQGQSFSFYDPD
ncbi:VOC family protein [Paenibacillus sacheonensis]|uniref:VOC domain-containing protein n=1 Tax=Paenibacillus sacheonensis TaxID=742054 RepID=A0A7X5BZ47_9BACL|nr:VOC family protein [Paenibacillus sacheonensis]MBM7566124.1 catechol 2,3-dioxygenase-like lactoylglutathione lyase family enzyme [Paenibacillus sacheonensis]NBC70337.1 hypothetical protein [Paenibacillus sacheonensis]